jgi:hypothetical protein
MARPVKISPRFTEDAWRRINFSTEDGWRRAIGVVEDRIEGRWLKWVDQIIQGSYSGFAVLVLDCVVLESIWGFQNGKAVPHRHEREVYREILSSRRFRWSEAVSDDFRGFVRNGLMHDAETRGLWLVEATIPKGTIVKRDVAGGGYVLNRTKFHKAVRGTFQDWLDTLRAGDVDSRLNMRKRMDEIIAKHYAT